MVGMPGSFMPGHFFEDTTDGAASDDGVYGLATSEPIEAIAEVTGATREDVEASLGNGQSLGEFGEALDFNIEDLVDIVLTRIQERLNAGVANGELTQAQADEIYSNISSVLTSALHGGLLEGLNGSDEPSDGAGLGEDACVPMPESMSANGAVMEGAFASTVCPEDS
jgi:hypothetical protein